MVNAVLLGGGGVVHASVKVGDDGGSGIGGQGLHAAKGPILVGYGPVERMGRFMLTPPQYIGPTLGRRRAQRESPSISTGTAPICDPLLIPFQSVQSPADALHGTSCKVRRKCSHHVRRIVLVAVLVVAAERAGPGDRHESAVAIVVKRAADEGTFYDLAVDDCGTGIRLDGLGHRRLRFERRFVLRSGFNQLSDRS